MRKNQLGFSLMEVILTITIIGVIGAITTGILTRTYRTSSTAETISKLKQNSAVASNILYESIRMADAVVCSRGAPYYDRIVIRNPEGNYTLFRFVAATPTENGYIAKSDNLDKSLLSPSNPNDFSYFCASDDTFGAEETILTDTNPDTGVSIENGQFTVIPGGVGKDTVTIKFEARPAVNEPDSEAVVPIQTTVQVR